MNAQYHLAAIGDLAEAVAYYDAQEEGLGARFANEVRTTVEKMARYPQAWAPMARGVRRCRTVRFPSGVFYQIRGDSILILAILHLRRSPETWVRRLDELGL